MESVDRVQLQPSLSVQQVLCQWPHSAAVFVAFKTGCVGCALARFCTLSEVAAVYDLQTEALLKRLAESIPNPNQRRNPNEIL